MLVRGGLCQPVTSPKDPLPNIPRGPSGEMIRIVATVQYIAAECFS